MNARLIALAGPSRGKSFDLTEDDFSIGVRRGGDIGDPVAVEIRHRQEGYRVGERGPKRSPGSGVMMMRHLHEDVLADKVKNAHNAVLEEADKTKLTRDVGGSGGTPAFADAVIARMR